MRCVWGCAPLTNVGVRLRPLPFFVEQCCPCSCATIGERSALLSYLGLMSARVYDVGRRCLHAYGQMLSPTISTLSVVSERERHEPTKLSWQLDVNLALIMTL